MLTHPQTRPDTLRTAPGKSPKSAALTRSYYRTNLWLLRTVKALLLAHLNDVEILEEVVVIHGFLIFARVIHEPDTVQTIAATVVADAKNRTQLISPWVPAIGTCCQSHHRSGWYRLWNRHWGSLFFAHGIMGSVSALELVLELAAAEGSGPSLELLETEGE